MNKTTNKQRKYKSANPIINAQIGESTADEHLNRSIVWGGFAIFLILMGLFVL